MSEKSFWEEHDLEGKIRDILLKTEYKPNPEHHFGKPFMSAYQIAFKFDELYHGIVEKLGYPIGGRGTNEQFSFTSYIAGQLSQRIKSGKITDIEGGFFSDNYLKDITFYYNGDVHSSLAGTSVDLSMFRLK